MSDSSLAGKIGRAEEDSRKSVNDWALSIVRNDVLAALPSYGFWISFDDSDSDYRCFWNRCGLSAEAWREARPRRESGPGSTVMSVSHRMAAAWGRVLKLIRDTTRYEPYAELIDSPKARYHTQDYRRHFDGYAPKKWVYKLTLNG